MSESLALISHSLADIGIVLHDIERDQQEILDLLRQREDLESRLAYLEHVVHGALMSDEVDDSTRSHGEEPG